MKRFLGTSIGLTAIFLLSLSSIYTSAAPLGRWVRIVTMKLSRDGNQGIYLVDNASIERRGNIRYYWVGLIYTKPVRVKTKGRTLTVSKVVSYTSVNCTDKSTHNFYKFGIFDPNDKLITTLDLKSGVLALPTQGTKVTGSYVCSRK